jgi:ubiquitin thioesterase protein OTUB1
MTTAHNTQENTDPQTAVPQEAAAPVVVTAETDISTLSNAQLYELNQDLLNDSVPARPLVDSLVPMSVLREEYENGSALFLQQIDGLVDKGFKSIHRTRGDGDCFYRSLAFAYVDQLLASEDPDLSATTSLSLIQSTESLLDQAGFQRMVYEDFMEAFTSIIQDVAQPQKRPSPQKLLEMFQDPESMLFRFGLKF